MNHKARQNFKSFFIGILFYNKGQGKDGLVTDRIDLFENIVQTPRFLGFFIFEYNE